MIIIQGSKYFLDELEKVAKKHGGAVKVSGSANMWLAKFMFKTRGYDAIQTKTGKRITPIRSRISGRVQTILTIHLSILKIRYPFRSFDENLSKDLG